MYWNAALSYFCVSALKADWLRAHTPNPFSLLHSNQFTPSKISPFFTFEHGNHTVS